MFQKIFFFLLRKKVETATGSVDQVSKTKVFMVIEGLLRLVEFVSPYLGHPYAFPPALHSVVLALAGISARDAFTATPAGSGSVSDVPPAASVTAVKP